MNSLESSNDSAQAARFVRHSLTYYLPHPHKKLVRRGQLEPDMESVSMKVNRPKPAKHPLADALLKYVGLRSDERYCQIDRRAELGNLAVVRSGQPTSETVPMMTVTDTYYSPLSTATEGWNAIRFTQGIFRVFHEKVGDAGYVENGLKFNVVEVDKDKHNVVAKVQTYDFSSPGGISFDNHVTEYFAEHGIESISEYPIFDLANFCITQAQASIDQI